MAVNINPIFVIQGNILPARISAANTASDGSGTLATVVTAATNGTRVDGIRFINSQVTAAASSAKVFRIFLSNASGANPRLIGELVGAAATRSTTAIGSTSVWTPDQPILMKSGQIMYVTQSVYAGTQDEVDACPYAADYNV